MLAIRLAAIRRAPNAALTSVRYMSSGDAGVVPQGSPGFRKKEKAHEDQYIHRHEEELLRKLRADIEKKKKELDSLEKEHKELEKQAKQ